MTNSNTRLESLNDVNAQLIEIKRRKANERTIISRATDIATVIIQ